MAKTAMQYTMEQNARDTEKARKELTAKLDFVRRQCHEALLNVERGLCPYLGFSTSLEDAVRESTKLSLLLEQGRDLKNLSDMEAK